MNRFMSQALAIFISVALLVSSTPEMSTAFPASPSSPAFIAALTPSEQLGYVASSYDPGHSTLPRLIIISDLHGHLEVQEKIIGMLETFVKRLSSKAAQSQVPIFLEGGWTPHLEEPLRTVKNSKVRAILAEYLLKKSELPAAQVFSERHVGATQFTLTGVENQEEYEANRARFAETYPVRKALLEALAKKEQSIAVVRKHTEVRAFRKLNDLRQDYQSGKPAGENYPRVLARHAVRYAIHNQYVETLSHPSAVKAGDFELALTIVHRQVLERLSGTRPISSYLRSSLKNEDVIRKNLAYIDGYLDLLKRVLGNQLTPQEVPYALAMLPRLVQVAEILLKNERLGMDISQGVRRSLDFYPYAFVRDETLVKNSLTVLESDPAHPSTGILVAGGFHSDAITEYLRDRKIPYLLVNPVVSREITAEEHLNYIKRICNEHVTPEEVSADFEQPWKPGLLTDSEPNGSVTDINVPAQQAESFAPQAQQLASRVKAKWAHISASAPSMSIPSPLKVAKSLAATVSNFFKGLGRLVSDSLSGKTEGTRHAYSSKVAHHGGEELPSLFALQGLAKLGEHKLDLFEPGRVIFSNDTYSELHQVVEDGLKSKDAAEIGKNRMLRFHDLPEKAAKAHIQIGRIVQTGPDQKIIGVSIGQGVTLRLNSMGDRYVAVRKGWAFYETLANAMLEAYRNQGSKLPEMISFQAMPENAVTRFQKSLRQSDKEKFRDRESNLLVLDQNSAHPIVMINEDIFRLFSRQEPKTTEPDADAKFADLKRILRDLLLQSDQSVVNMKEPDRRKLIWFTALTEEFKHIFSPAGRKGYMEEMRTAAETLAFAADKGFQWAMETLQAEGLRPFSAGSSYRDFVKRFLTAVQEEIPNKKDENLKDMIKALDDVFNPDALNRATLTELIANIIDNVELRKARIKKVVDDLSKEFPDVPPETIEQMLDQEQSLLARHGPLPQDSEKTLKRKIGSMIRRAGELVGASA